jgi:hypothetical protein
VKSAVIVVFQNKVFGDILLKGKESGERDEP